MIPCISSDTFALMVQNIYLALPTTLTKSERIAEAIGTADQLVEHMGFAREMRER